MICRLLVALALVAAVLSAGQPVSAEVGELKAQTAQPSTVLVEDVDFWYRLDSDTKFLDLRSEWESGHKGNITLEELADLAWDAYNQSDVEDRLEIWREQGGPDPLVFAPKIHVRNNTNRAWLNVKLKVVIRAKIGELLADPELFLTDYDHLSATAAWENLYVEDLTIDVLAPGEEALVAATPFQLYDFLSIYKNRWPEYVEVEARLTEFADPETGVKARALQMIPDHFIVPVESRRRLTQ